MVNTKNLKYRKFLLISPDYRDINSFPDHPPVGLGYIAEALYKNNIPYEIFDMGLKYSEDRLFKKIIKYNPDIIGITMMTFAYKHTYRLLNKIKEKFLNVSIVVGGPHISTFREEALRECGEIDFGIVLEGDESIVEIVIGKNPNEIKGLIYRENEKVLFTGERSFISDIDSIEFPKYNYFELSKYQLPGMIPIVTSRGCPYECIFCSTEASIGKKFRFRSPENILAEIEYWYKRGYKHFKILDDNFTLIKERVHKFCELIEKSDFKKLRFELASGIRADKIDKELLKRLKNIGVFALAFGVEAGNERILKNLKKGETIDKMKEAIKNACDIGLNVHLLFLIGSPGETLEDIKDSEKLAKEFSISFANFNNLIPYPKTELFEWIKKNNYFVKEPGDYLNNVSYFDNEPCFTTPELNYNDRKKTFDYLNNIAKEIKKKAIARRLKKYFGGLSNIISTIYMSDIFQYFFRRDKFLKRIIFELKHKLKLEK